MTKITRKQLSEHRGSEKPAMMPSRASEADLSQSQIPHKEKEKKKKATDFIPNLLLLLRTSDSFIYS